MATNREIFDEIAESWYRLRHWCRFSTELGEMVQRWKGGRLLNVGCAHGPDFLPFKDGFELFGVDFSTEMVRLAQRYSAKFDFTANLFIADAISLPFSDSSFDCAISVATYHHIRGNNQRLAAFEELRRVLKPGAEAFITVWNRWQPRFWLKGNEMQLAWRSRGRNLYRYYHLFSYDEFNEVLSEAGFEVISMSPENSYRFLTRFFSRNICALVTVA